MPRSPNDTGNEPHKYSSWKLVEELERIVTVTPLIEYQRNVLMAAAERLKYLDD